MPTPCKNAFDSTDLAKLDDAMAAVVSRMGPTLTADAVDDETRKRIREIVMAVAANAPTASHDAIADLVLRRLAN